MVLRYLMRLGCNSESSVESFAFDYKDLDSFEYFCIYLIWEIWISKKKNFNCYCAQIANSVKELCSNDIV